MPEHVAVALRPPKSAAAVPDMSECTPVTGPDALALRDALASANQATHWSQDGAVYSLALRPVLPGEAVCP